MEGNMTTPSRSHSISQGGEGKTLNEPMQCIVDTTRSHVLNVADYISTAKEEEPPEGWYLPGNSSPVLTQSCPEALSHLSSAHGTCNAPGYAQMIPAAVEGPGPIAHRWQGLAANGDIIAALDNKSHNPRVEEFTSTNKGKSSLTEEDRKEAKAGDWHPLSVSNHPLQENGFNSRLSERLYATDGLQNPFTAPRDSLQPRGASSEEQRRRSVTPKPKPLIISWNDSLYQLLNSAPRITADHQMLEKGDRTMDTTRGAEDSRRVPNFSYPVSAIRWNQQLANRDFSRLDSSGESAGNQAVTSTDLDVPALPASRKEIPNSESSKPHNLPSGLPTVDEFAETDRILSQANETLIDVSRLSSTSSNTRERAHRGTIAVQLKMIQDLHAIIDKQRTRILKFEEQTVPKFEQWLQEQAASIGLLSEDVESLKDENATLKVALVFGNKVLGGCFSREWSLWKLLDDIKERRRGKMGIIARRIFRKKVHRIDEELRQGLYPAGFKWEIFGHGPNPTRSKDVSKSEQRSHRVNQELCCRGKSNALLGRKGGRCTLKRNEFEAVITCARQNINILDEDLAEMVQLIRGCKMQATGIEEMHGEVEGESQSQSIRTV